jgi:hypothetical protein
MRQVTLWSVLWKGVTRSMLQMGSAWMNRGELPPLVAKSPVVFSALCLCTRIRKLTHIISDKNDMIAFVRSTQMPCVEGVDNGQTKQSYNSSSIREDVLNRVISRSNSVGELGIALHLSRNERENRENTGDFISDLDFAAGDSKSERKERHRGMGALQVESRTALGFVWV